MDDPCTEDELDSDVSVNRSYSSDVDIRASEPIRISDLEDLEDISTSPSGGTFLFPFEGHDIIIERQEGSNITKRIGNIRKEAGNIRKEALKKGGRAGNYLMQVPRTVSNSVEVTSQMLKDAVNAEILERKLSHSDNAPIAVRESEKSGTYSTGKRGKVLQAIQQSIEAMHEQSRENVGVISQMTYEHVQNSLNEKLSPLNETIDELKKQNTNLISVIENLQRQNELTSEQLKVANTKVDLLFFMNFNGITVLLIFYYLDECFRRTYYFCSKISSESNYSF